MAHLVISLLRSNFVAFGGEADVELRCRGRSARKGDICRTATISVHKRLDDLINIRSPTIQCVLPFGQKLMPLINRGHPRPD